MIKINSILVTSLFLSILLASTVGCAQTATPSAPTLASTITSTPTPTPTPTPDVASIVWTKPGVPVTLTVDIAAYRATYKSGSMDISGYFYRPPGTGPFPAVLILHGASGLQQSIAAKASWLALQGYIAFAPDYFTPIGVAGGAWTGPSYKQYTDQIRQILGDGLEALTSLSYVDSTHLGAMGFSLGGYYAAILGTRNDVKGIVSYYGAFTGPPINQNPVTYTPVEIANQMRASVLMFQGDADQLVPIANANVMANLLTSAGKDCQYVVYPGAQHTFDATSGPTANPQAAADANQKSITFLQAKLR